MKSALCSAAYLYLHVWLAHGSPAAKPQVRPDTTRPTLATVAASPYPTPTANEFEYVNYNERSNEDKGDRFVVHSAFLPFAQILRAAVLSVDDPNDKTYERWFPADVKRNNGQSSLDGREYVKKVYHRLLLPGLAVIPDPRVRKLISDHDDFANGCKPATRAYMTRSLGRFHICKPKGLLNQPMVASAANCSSLGTLVSRKMQSLSGTLIHEFMHWNEVGDKVPNSVGHITDVTYGALKCMQLANGSDNQKTFVNADSYKWMALNAYYNSVCNRNFGDPILTTQELDESKAELQASPEYQANHAPQAAPGWPE